MKNSIKHSLIATAALLLLAGCDVKDPIYNTPHPEKGAVTLTTDWSNIGKGLTAPDSYNVAAAGYTGTLSGAVNRLDYLFDPATLRINVYNTVEHVSINGTTATVATAPGNVDGVDQFIQNTPGWLFASSGEIMVEKDKEHSHTAVMRQQVRQLTIIIEPTGETTDRIESITGTLSGVASLLDFAGGTHGAPANVALTFARIADGDNAGRWSATVRLLGTAGEQQKLTANICFTNGNPAAVDLDSDLTTVLATFNADKRTPLTLGGRVVETPTGAGFTATIDDWTPGNGDGEDIDANV